MQRPLKGEYPAYFENYIKLVPEGKFTELLKENTIHFTGMLEQLDAELHEYRYAEGKWSIKELLMHITDVERVMAYRALVASRADESTIVYPMQDELYVKNSGSEHLSFSDVLNEFKSTRQANLFFFGHLSDEQSRRTVKTPNQPFTARSLAYIILGHCLHHEKVLSEKYLSK